MRATDTHAYDGQLSQRKLEIDKHLTKAAKRGKEERIKTFNRLLAHLRTKACFSPQTEANLTTIIRDFVQDNAGPNYDSTNNLFAIDLLCLCSDLCFEVSQEVSDEVSTILNVQLDEMSSGMCAPGRTTRLFQVVATFSEYLPEHSKPKV